MNKKILSKTLLSLSIPFFVANQSFAKQSNQTSPWGNTGLINMPTANTLEFGEFYITGNYLFPSNSLVGSANIGIFNGLELGITGGRANGLDPKIGFNGLAGNLKYQLIKPQVDNPTSLAVGLNLIGLSKDTELTTGNYLYMVLSHDFNWQLENGNYNLFSGHIGFGGNFWAGSRMMAGIDIPVTEYFDLNAEYIGKVGDFSDQFNFGIKAKPLPFLSASILSIGPASNDILNNREYFFNLSFTSKIPGINSQPNDRLVTKKKVLPENNPSNKVIKKEEPQGKVIEKPNVVVGKINATKKLVKKVNTLEGKLKGSVLDRFSKKKLDNVEIKLKGLTNKKFSQTIKTSKNSEFNLDKLPEGEYLAYISKDGFLNQTKRLYVKNDKTTNLNVLLSQAVGNLSGVILDSNNNPLSDIEIIVDNNNKVKSNQDGKYSFLNLSEGSHSMKFMKDDQKIKSLNVDILAGKEIKKEIVLDIKSDTKDEKIVNNSIINGVISDKSGPIKKVRITLEGKGGGLTVLTMTGEKGEYTIKNIPRGSYKLTVSKKGYKKKIYSVKIKDNQKAKHNVTLKTD